MHVPLTGRTGWPGRSGAGSIRRHALAALAALLLSATAGTAVAGPLIAGPPGGGVSAIVVAPSKKRTIYVSTGGTLFRTRDGGRRWALVPQGLRTSLYVFAVHPTRPSWVYGIAGLSASGGRLVVSRDSGLHWRPLGDLRVPDPAPSSLAIDPRRPRVLYARVESSIYRSADGGLHWRLIEPAGRIAFGPRGAVILGSKGLYRSADHGRSWRRTGVGLRFVDTLVADPTRPGTLFARVSGGRVPGIRRSRDGGRSWKTVARGYYDALVMDPRAPSTLYATTQTTDEQRTHLWRTTDGGRRWRTADRGIDLGFALGPIALGAGRPPRVYLSTGGFTEGGRAPGGLRFSADRGRRWRPTGAGLVSSSVVASATAARCPARLYAVTGTLGSGEGSHLYASASGARTWTIPAAGPRTTDSSSTRNAVITSVAVDAGDSRTAYVGIRRLEWRMWRTTDAGRRWRPLRAAPTMVDRLFADPRTPGVVFASRPGQLLVTRDRGATWTPTDLSLPDRVQVTAMAFDPARPGVLYVSTRAQADGSSTPRAGDGVFASADGGATWTARNAGLGDTQVGALALDPRHPAQLYAATESNGVFRSTDAGLSWQQVGTGPASGLRDVNVLAVDPATSALYAGGGVNAFGDSGSVVGLWRSADGGRSWSAVAPNYVRAVVGGISFDATGTFLDASTHGLGVVRIRLRPGAAPRCRV